jgi:putative ABC transport system ATP-binding protein
MLLELEHVSKRFAVDSTVPPTQRVALDDVSLGLERGQIVGVFGPSGSGKSTLLRVAAGLLAPDSGEIRFDGERIDRLPASERKRLRRREISCVWSGQQEQERLTVQDHVALALLVDGRDHRHAQRAAREALLACEVDHCAEMELATLSDGERQRVQIARAIVTEPRLLLADRPASSLSLVEQEAVMALLAALAHEAKVAVLVADSDANALLCAQPILYLRDGQLVNATPAEGGRVYRFPARPRRAAADA